MSIDSNRALGARFFAEQDRLKGGPEPSLCAPSYVAEIVGFPMFDRAGHEQFAQAFYSAFPDIRHHVQDTVADIDKVAVRVVLRGTHTGNFFGIPATQRAVEVAMTAILQIRDEKVTRLAGIFDQLGLMQQLGVVPVAR